MALTRTGSIAFWFASARLGTVICQYVFTNMYIKIQKDYKCYISVLYVRSVYAIDHYIALTNICEHLKIKIIAQENETVSLRWSTDTNLVAERHGTAGEELE